MRHASRSGSLFYLEASHTKVSQSGLKTGGGVTTDSARDTIMEVAQDPVEDGRINMTGCVGPDYPYFTVFYVLVFMGIVVF
jgi:hypothetical protein